MGYAKMKLKIKRRKKSKIAISEVLGTVLLMALTIVIGFAAWMWASSAAASAERNFGDSIQSNISCLSQNFVITNANFSATSHNLVTVWFFNNGIGSIGLSELTISNASSGGTWSYSNSTLITASTTVAAGSGSQNQVGQNVIAVASTAGFVAGQSVELNTGGPRDETLVIQSLGSGTITFTSNLLYTHSVGDTVTTTQLTQGQISAVTFNAGTTLSGQWSNNRTLYSFSAVAQCQGDIISNYQQVW